MELDSAWERINTELTRSRRFNRPLTVLLVEMKHMNGKLPLRKIDSLQRDLLKRFAVSKAGQIISNLARQTDLIIRENNERFMIVCPETDLRHSTFLAERVCHAIQEAIDENVVWGAASFPEESFSFEELLEKAGQRLGYVDASSLASQVKTNVENSDR